MSKKDVLAAIGAMVVDDDFRAEMVRSPDEALARFERSLPASLTEDERVRVKLFAGHGSPVAAVPGLMPGPCPWWPCLEYHID